MKGNNREQLICPPEGGWEIGHKMRLDRNGVFVNRGGRQVWVTRRDEAICAVGDEVATMPLPPSEPALALTKDERAALIDLLGHDDEVLGGLLTEGTKLKALWSVLDKLQGEPTE